MNCPLFSLLSLLAFILPPCGVLADERIQLASVAGTLPGAPAADEGVEKARRYLGYMKVKPDGAALRTAVGENRTYTIDLLLQAGVAIDARDDDGRTPLMLASLRGSMAMVDHLLKKGATVDATDKSGETPLMLAIDSGEKRVLDALLQAGANPDLADESGRRALHRAIAREHPEIIGSLLAAGAQATLPDEPEAPLTLALRSANPALIHPLTAHGAPPVDWQPESTALFWKSYAAEDEAMLGLLQKSHATPPALAGSEQPLLAEAVLWRDAKLVTRLLRWGCDPNTPLHIPARAAFINTTGKPGLRFYLEEEPGMNVLMLAAGLGSSEAVAALLEAGATPAARTERYKMPALSFAGRTGTPECERLLLGLPVEPARDEISIRISIKLQQATISKWGEAPIHTAVSTGRSEFPTQPGHFVITDKHRVRVSSIYDVPMPFFMRLSGRDFGLHEGHVPGYAASHGCIRVPEEMARKLYQMASVGTYVTIEE